MERLRYGNVRVCLLLAALYVATNVNCQTPGKRVDAADRATIIRQGLVPSKFSPEFVYLRSARQQLKSILAAPEFADKMHEATAWERWQHEIGIWFVEQIERLFKSIAQHPTTSQIIFWTGGLGSLALIASLLFRIWRRNNLVPASPAFEGTATNQSAEEWMAAARAAAARGDLNHGIQCSYWAGIACLQGAGTLPKAGWHTPREFLRALDSASAQDELRRLTSSLETFWYGRVPASADDFAACLRSVEALGCKLD